MCSCHGFTKTSNFVRLNRFFVVKRFFFKIESKFLAVNNGWITSTWMMALKALGQPVSVAAGLLLEDIFFHIKISPIDRRCGQKPSFTF
jgi:hypothetical protein